MHRICRLLLLLPLIASTVLAGDLILPAPEATVGDLEYVEPILAKNACCMAVCDHANLLAVGHRAGKGPGPRLSLFRLDAQGQVGEPVSVEFPSPASLKARPSQALCLVFHPKLPLLYVWRDVPPLENPEAPDPAAKEIEHLLIYSLEAKEPQLLLALCKGESFAAARTTGTIALDATGKRLYLPNLLGKVKEPTPKTYYAVGWINLDGQGLPALPGPAQARPAQLAALTALVQKGETPGQLTATDSLAPFDYLAAGLGFIPISDTMVIVGGTYGPTTWDQSNRRARFNSIYLHPDIAAPHLDRTAGHPTLPVVYSSCCHIALLFAVEHADGYLTLSPQRVGMPGAPMLTYPVVLTKRSLVAVGGPNRVHFVRIDKDGRFKNERIDLEVRNPAVEAIAYSEKFDRLFLAVEKLP
jgi:hypothetical protein